MRLLRPRLLHSWMLSGSDSRLNRLNCGGIWQLCRRYDGAGIAGYVDGSIGQWLAGGERYPIPGSCLASVHRAWMLRRRMTGRQGVGMCCE